MAKREISSTLRNLKFMQRAALREEKVKKQVEDVPDGNFFSPGTIRKCVVILEGDPHPGAALGRMSFGSFNPSVDKHNEDGADLSQAGALDSHDTGGGTFFRGNGSSMDEAECSNTSQPNSESNGNHKRKQSEVVSDTEKQNTPKIVQGGQHSSPNSSKGHFKQSKSNKLDWNVLRRNGQNKKG